MILKVCCGLLILVVSCYFGFTMYYLLLGFLDFGAYVEILCYVFVVLL